MGFCKEKGNNSVKVRSQEILFLQRKKKSLGTHKINNVKNDTIYLKHRRQGVKNGFKLRWPSTYYRVLYEHKVRYKPNGNHKIRTTNKYAQTKKEKSKYITKEEAKYERKIDQKRSEKLTRNSHKASNKMAINTY